MEYCLVVKACMAIYILLQTVAAEKTYYHWQCSLPSNKTIQSLVEQNFEAFRVIGWPAWMSKKILYINCAKRGLKRIPQGLDDSVKILDLGRNSITHINKNEFITYSSLVAISLIDNCVFLSHFRDPMIRRCSGYLTVEKGAFSDLTKLKYLALSSTALIQLPELLPQNIKILMAGFVFMAPIQKKDVETLRFLELVSFSTNCIVTDKKHFCARNFTISESVFSSPKLKFLDLAFNNFTSVPCYLFQQSLVGIKLRGNPLNWIRSNDFNNATNITYLNLAYTSRYSRVALQIEKGSFQLLKNLQILDLSVNMISSLPYGTFSSNFKLRALNLELNCLKMIETNPIILPSLPFLKELSLAGNTYCNKKVIKHMLPKLEFRNSYLRFPNLTTLSLGILQQFPDTEFEANYLYMYLSYGYKYDRVDNDSFKVLKKLPRLKNLGLVACNIRVLNTLAFDDLNFTHLDLQVNRIGEETKKLKMHLELKQSAPRQTDSEWKDNTKYLNSKEFGVYAVYDSLYKHRNNWQGKGTPKAVVNFSRNAISNLKTFCLKYFRSVTHLDLSRNHINYIREDDFQHLSQIQALDLRYNPIRHIHYKALTPLVQLKNLQINLTLYQRDFSITFLQKTSYQNLTLKYGDTDWQIYRLFQYYGTRNTSVNFQNITAIDLSYIRIPPFYVSRNLLIFGPLRNLTSLVMDGAQFSFHPQSNFFGGLLKLRRLSMRECWLEEFPYQALNPLLYLEHLDLSYNKIEVLDNHSNCSFPNLKTLILSYNFIYKIFPGTLRSFFNKGLRNIDLSFNKITFFDPSVIDRVVLQNMDYIDLRGNAVNCECSLSYIFGWLINSNQLNNSKLPGLLPDCSISVVNYYGGCIACDLSSTSENPLSLFTYTVTNNCHEPFLLRLVAWFNFGILLFLIIPLSYKALKKKLLNFLLSDFRVESFLSRTNGDVSSSTTYAYHGFVYYDNENMFVGDWVEKLLIPTLEKGKPSFKMGVVGREDWCGTTQVQQLLLKMRASRKIIIILSGNFLSTPKCQYVLSVLEEWFYTTKEDKCILISFGEISENVEQFTPKLFRKNSRCSSLSMLYYSPTEKHSLFWDVLANALMLPFHYYENNAIFEN